MGKLHNLQIINKLVAATPLTAISLLMRNFMAKVIRIIGICKDFTANRVNELGNVPRCGVVPKFSDLEVIALGITAEDFRDKPTGNLRNFANRVLRYDISEYHS